MEQFVKYDKELLEKTKEELSKIINDINISINEIKNKAMELNIRITGMENVGIRYNNKFMELYNFFKKKNSSLYYQEINQGIIKNNYVAKLLHNDLLEQLEKANLYLFLMSEELKRIEETREEYMKEGLKNIFVKLLVHLKSSEDEVRDRMLLPQEEYEKLIDLISKYAYICNDLYEYNIKEKLIELTKDDLENMESSAEEKKSLVETLVVPELKKLGYNEETISNFNELYTKEKPKVLEKNNIN